MLNKKTHYMQIALNSDLSSAERIISTLPVSERIILEAGTPLIKEYGARVIDRINKLWTQKMIMQGVNPVNPYVVADLKCMDRGEREVSIARKYGASAAVVLGIAPTETIDIFIKSCKSFGLDSMIDMMNVEQPYKILRQLKELPKVVILHRGVDEEKYSEKPLPVHMINKLKGTYDIMIAIAGGDTNREIQSSVFNGADIVVLWKDFYRPGDNSGEIAREFLQEIK